MNCNDINRVLDEREATELSAAESAGIEAHVAHCTECAQQVSASAHMTQFRCDVPPLPAALREHARRLQAACESAPPPKSTRRPLIFGSLFVLGAAATTFTAVAWRDASAANR
jgi:hypothetical protein